MFGSATTIRLTAKRLVDNDIKTDVIPSKRRPDFMHKYRLTPLDVRLHFLAPVGHMESTVG